MLVIEGFKETVGQSGGHELIMRQERRIGVVEDPEKVIERHVAHIGVGVIELRQQPVEVLLHRLSVGHGFGD